MAKVQRNNEQIQHFFNEMRDQLCRVSSQVDQAVSRHAQAAREGFARAAFVHEFSQAALGEAQNNERYRTLLC
jgi:hypothetical protein